MTGALSLRLGACLGGAAALLGLSVFALNIGSAAAEKVGVAAAVNPDAFSSLAGKPQTQLNIGKSIFYNERINTTGSGLVQVLLVDGSTFTVGPGSDLVIDKFVYNPKKGVGQISASFSKGVARFVGGKISKNENGVVVDTPAGALAIRGGMAQWKLNGSKGIFSFLYGKEMKLGSYTVYEPGYTIDTTTGVPNIRPTTSADIATIMASLTNGNTGGIGGETPDPPQPSELVNTQSLNQLISDATATQIQSEIQDQLNQPTNTPPPPETVVVPDQLTLRVLSSPDYYLANQRTFFGHSYGGTFIADPGAHGILGGDDVLIPCFLSPDICGGSYAGFFKVDTDDFDMTWTSVADGRATGMVPSLIARTGFLNYAKTEEGPFDFPVFNVVGVHAVTDATMIDKDGNIVTLTGSAFTGRGGGFFAYQLFESGDLNRPVLAFGGTPFETDDPDQLRLFNLYTDPRQNISIPFAAKATTPTNLAGATIQPLYLLENTGESGRSVWLQTSFLIQGQGPGQETILVLALGEQNGNGQLEGFRRGMSQIQVPVGDGLSFGLTFNLSGEIATLAGPDNETHLFGDQLPHFVIGADSTGKGHDIFQDEWLYGGHSNTGLEAASFASTSQSSAIFGATYHIGEQVAQAPSAQVTPAQQGDFYGYAAGVYQQTADGLGPDEAPVGMMFNSDPSQVHLKFKDENRLSAFFDLTGAGEEGGGGARLAFGDWGGASGRSAVINGNIYAAIESGTVPSTAIVDGGEVTETRFADASLYLVSGNLLNPSVAPCNQCDFIKWGTWGGQIKFKDDVGVPVTAHVNLGWYVAGDITSSADLDNWATWLATGPTASYSGSAIGNVARLTDTGWSTYVATGDLAMNWNFSNRLGDLTISKFDTSVTPGGLTFSGPMCAPGVSCGANSPVPAGNHFGGPLSVAQTGSLPTHLNDLAGSAVGSFVNNGSTKAAGVIGNWNVGNDVYGAAGVFAGRR